MPVTSGNAAADGREFGFWFLGDLRRWSGAQGSETDFGLRQATVEMKWGVHRKGDARAQWGRCSEMRTISLLVSGIFRLQFRSPAARETVTERLLTRPGDYAVWGTDVEHVWFVEEDAVIVTVRWKEPVPQEPSVTPASASPTNR